MSAAPDQTPNQTHAERLRAEFDRGFTQPATPRAEALADFVLVIAGPLKIALAPQGLASIEHVLSVVPVPSSAPALVGITGLRNAVVPLFNLATLLGHPGSMSPAWQRAPVFGLVEIAEGPHRAQRLGIAFDRLEQFIRVAPDQVFASPTGAKLSFQDELYLIAHPDDLVRQITTPAATRNAIEGDQIS